MSDFFRIDPAGLDRFFSTAAVKPPRPDDELLRRVGLVCCRGEEAGEDDCERSARARGENIARKRRMLRTFS